MSTPIRTRPALTAVALLALVGAVTATPVQAVDQPGEEVVADGLNNPRHLSFTSGGDLYVAESGVPGAGDGPCIVSEEFGDQCLDDSGSITRLSRSGRQSRVLTGLPSVVSTDEAVGPSDVVIKGHRAVVSFGLGGDLAKRQALGEGGELLGTVAELRMRGHGRSVALDGVRVVADLVLHEESDPDGAGVDSNPVDVVRDGNGVLATDAGGNTVVRGVHGRATTLAVLPEGSAEAPPFLELPPGTMIPFQAVPTATQRGPDGAWYVSQLTGFPFPVGQSSVWRLDGGVPEVWATGLTNVTDIAWGDDGELYAVQLADAGLLAGDLMGSLVRVDPGGDHETVGGPWFAPYGVALQDGQAYVTTCSVCAGGGQVVRVPLP